MTKRSVTHATFTIERVYDASPARVFRAFAEASEKTQWFHGPEEWGPGEHTMDFRVGGRETSRGGPKGGTVHFFNAMLQDIVPDERIVSTYELTLDGVRISVSLATTELKPDGNRTRLVYTEQGVYLDGYDDAGAREHGTRELFEALGKYLSRTG
jgi:uncharacterized protein YndB with AHSA1/START domain